MLGGLQRLHAIREINASSGNRKIATRRCAIYGSELSEAAKVYLANEHNEANQIQRTSNFSEIASVCRKFAVAHFTENAVDSPQLEIKVPYFNTQEYKDFKRDCQTLLIGNKAVSIHT